MAPPPSLREAASAPLFSPAQITGATLVGSLPAGAALLATNYVRLRKRGLATTTIAVTVAIVAVEIFVPTQRLPLLALASVGAMHRALRDGTLFDAHVAHGGAKASSWLAAGIAVTSLLGIAVLVGAVPLASFLPP